MQKIFIASIVLSIFMASAAVALTPPFPGSDAGVLPDSPFYIVKIIGEKVRGFFIFSETGKIKYQLELADRRLKEAQALALKGRGDLATKSVEQYQLSLNRVTDAIQKAGNRPDILALKAFIESSRKSQVQVLQDISKQLTNQASEKVQDVIDNAQKNLGSFKISLLSPTSGTVGTKVTILAFGFTPSNNAVQFGEGYIKGLKSSDGTSLEFEVPEGLDLCSPRAIEFRHPCPQAYPRVLPGDYKVAVININGTSNYLLFTVTARPGESPAASPTPSSSFSPATSIKPSSTPEPSISLVPSSIATPSPSPVVSEVTVEGDDYGLYPATVNVPKNAQIRLTFKARAQNVYYGGLDFRSVKFNTPTVHSGGAYTVEFVADSTFTYTSYWPSSGVRKADGTIMVGQ